MAALQHGGAMPGLVKGLGAWQILFITIGGTIGLGFATTTGEVLAISGPGGVLIAFGVVGLISICVMEGICDMIVLLPISNAMIEFVRAFVDPDLAIVVGFAYWYTYCVNLAALIIGTVDLFKYWNISFALQNVLYVVFLGLIFAINSRGVKLFGWIELVGGVFKVLLMLVIFIIMMCINYGNIGDAGPIKDIFFNDGVRNNPNVASSHFTAVLASIPLAIFSYIGIEVITVTAFEARNPSQLKWPAKHIAFIIMAIYLIIIGGFVANIEWFNQSLPEFLSQSLVSIRDVTLGHDPFDWPVKVDSRSKAAPVIAVMQAGVKVLPGLLNGFIIYSGVSVANTVLYVASRTLYGLTRDLSHNTSSKIMNFIANLNKVSPTTRIPVWSLVVSLLIFSIWLPFIHLSSSFTQTEMQEVLISVGSVGCLLVWASQCLAFIRYELWLSYHKGELVGEHMGKFQRWPQAGFSSYLSSGQPILAYIGLISCLGIVLILNSVSMWNGEQLKLKALTVYLGPALLLLMFIVLKLFNRRSYVRLGDWNQLRATLTTLNDLIESVPQVHPQSPPNQNGFAQHQPLSPGFSSALPQPAVMNGHPVPPLPPVLAPTGLNLPPTVDQLDRDAHPNHSNSISPNPYEHQFPPQEPNIHFRDPAYELSNLDEPVSPGADMRHGSVSVSAYNGAEGSYGHNEGGYFGQDRPYRGPGSPMEELEMARRRGEINEDGNRMNVDYGRGDGLGRRASELGS
ncbi:amino acid permease-domain-containing protein [Halenospora varia]|nr:amino acid permease-domain-containing protein [Halenospora varia]